MLEKFFLKSYQPLAIHSKLWIGSPSTHNETYCNLRQQFYAIGLQVFSKTSKRKSEIHLKLRKLRVEAKKTRAFLENRFFVYWASLYCKSS